MMCDVRVLGCTLLVILLDCGVAQYSPEEKLNIISEKGYAVLKVGEKRALYCVSQEPGIQWLDPTGAVVGPRGPSRHVHVEEVTGQLILMFDDPKLSDNGTWTCRARSMESRIAVFVFEKAQFDPQEKIMTAMEGKEITLTCAAKGFPKPRLTWHRNGALMTALWNPGKYDVWEGRLVIRGLTREDSGSYECRAHQNTSVWNNTASSVTKILVRHGPIMLPGKYEKIYALYDHIRILRCSALAFPNASYRWSHRTPRGSTLIPEYSGDVFSARDGSYSELTVRVNGKDDLGDYVCHAKNAHGSNQTIFHLVKGLPPKSPHWVQYNDSTVDALVFKLDCDNCTEPEASTPSSIQESVPEVGYRFELMQQTPVGQHRKIPPVYWEDDDRDTVLVVDVPRSKQENFISVGGLRPKTTYVVRVAKLNLAGPSDFIELNTQFTTAAAYPAAPAPSSHLAFIIFCAFQLFI